jgi:hypothetical protein
MTRTTFGLFFFFVQAVDLIPAQKVTAPAAIPPTDLRNCRRDRFFNSLPGPQNADFLSSCNEYSISSVQVKSFRRNLITFRPDMIAEGIAHTKRKRINKEKGRSRSLFIPPG